jgi:sugar phosphate isomerase/epimerase
MLPVTYCTNIHPGETWQETLANLDRHVLPVKRALSPDRPWPIGLRISGRAAGELDRQEAERFNDWCRSVGLTVVTLNGFPFGRFHGQPVKTGVYLPDWRDPARLDYTRKLADLLVRWLPADASGSISTVPVGFKRDLTPEGIDLAMVQLRRMLEHLDALAQRSGSLIRLSLEPEPACLLETTDEVVRFFGRIGLPPRLAPHLAVCYDCCHQALQFESPLGSLRRLQDNGIPIGHVQVSSALELSEAPLETLRRYCEPVYLHQTVGRLPDGRLVRFDDLDQALADGNREVTCWRVHYHVPVFIDRLIDCGSTQPFLKEILPHFAADTPLEVETYTWSILPPDLQTATVTESIIREIRWVEAHRHDPSQREGP